MHIYELDPTFSYKNQNAIQIPYGKHLLYQMQIVDNLFVMHNVSAKTSQMWDLKLPEYHIPLVPEKAHTTLGTRYLQQTNASSSGHENFVYLSDLIMQEEKLTEETYTKPVMRESGIVDPGSIHMLLQSQ